ncbi:phosphomannomutase [Sinimarinibacterium flocculans]|uniref:phosphomannomutase n=1 Tax=Sinimarinibacterium flocculans TaxID=985250 RepID=A0A318EDJ0_9GAMM|nr:phosphomannomutase [Sinimarinibacterium flocculans]PXV67804.1 phosphomannomutase [Sinimarinibacterium flocculans]HBG29748.1 phosphomannomutase [Gammaproteobacteria bacterium]
METLSCFKAYDIRGRVPDELNEAIAYRLGVAYAKQFDAQRVVVGHDVRHSSRPLLEALARGLTARGVEVIDIGLCGTEEVYFATFDRDLDGGIMVTASHNPADYNGMKLVRSNAQPVSGDSGLRELERAVALSSDGVAGELRLVGYDGREAYVRHLLGYVDVSRLKPLKLVVNAGNGTAGLVIDALAPHLPFEFVRMHHAPDPTFPNGIPNPLLPENRAATAEAVRESGADFGIAWDGDFDRCFLFDEQGRFIEGYYIVGLLAEALLKRDPGAKIIHDPRLTWNTIDIVRASGGIPVQSKTGHAFIKERMRLENAVYGGEMSAHHYFRDFAYCDNGTIPWLLVAALVSEKGAPLSSLVDARIRRFPSGGEINRRVASIADVLKRIEARYADAAQAVDHTDGLSVEYPDWRFNLRASNTEPLLRLNVEARGDEQLMRVQTGRLLALIDELQP